MKKYTLFLCTVFLTTLFSPEAWSKSFYKSKLKIKLTYSKGYPHPLTRAKTIGRTTATVIMSDKNDYAGSILCELKINGKTYKCQSQYSTPNNYNIVIPESELKAIFEDEFKIESNQLSQMQFAYRMLARRSYSDFYGTQNSTNILIYTVAVHNYYSITFKTGKARKLKTQ